MSEVYGLIHNHMLGEESETIKQSKYQDYVGFIFNDKHSSDLGIVRTSNGSRFDENLLPTIQDKTVQVPGGDGTYFFGSYYTQKQFTIPFAFDSLTEEKFKKLKAWLGDKKIHDLIFDEAPYKVYKAKVTGSATIKHIPFMELDDNGDEIRIYKGEGSIQFTCYQPYARSRFKTLEEYEAEGYENVKEWAAASGILKANHEVGEEEGALAYSDFDKPSTSSINLYNPGHIDSHFKLRLNFVISEYQQVNGTNMEFVYEPNKYYVLRDDEYIISDGTNIIEDEPYYAPIVGVLPEGGISVNGNILKWKTITLKGNDSYIKIDSKMNLIEGYGADNKKSGNIYNEYITNGTFFKIPVGESVMSLINSSDSPSSSIILPEASIEYDYYYL